jgi:hypothetical protein
MTRWGFVVTLCLAMACSSGGGGAPSGASAPTAAQPTAAPTPGSAAGTAASAPAASGNPYLAQPGQPLTPIKVATCAVSGGFIHLYTAIEAKIFEK